MNRTVTGLMMGMSIAVVLGIGTSLALAHGGGTPSYGMGHMGMMGERGMTRHMGGMGHMGMMEMMHGPGMMGGMGMGRIQMLDLTKEQRASIHKLQDQLRKTNWGTMGKVMDESSKLRELFAADKPDPKKIGAVYGNIFDLKRQMIESKIDTHNRADAVLTEEQREQLKQIHHGMGRPGYRGMRHGSGMGG
jgi:Spy/CpxP family protein refolding chaperone